MRRCFVEAKVASMRRREETTVRALATQSVREIRRDDEDADAEREPCNERHASLIGRLLEESSRVRLAGMCRLRIARETIL